MANFILTPDRLLTSTMTCPKELRSRHGIMLPLLLFRTCHLLDLLGASVSQSGRERTPILPPMLLYVIFWTVLYQLHPVHQYKVYIMIAACRI